MAALLFDPGVRPVLPFCELLLILSPPAKSFWHFWWLARFQFQWGSSFGSSDGVEKHGRERNYFRHSG